MFCHSLWYNIWTPFPAPISSVTLFFFSGGDVPVKHGLDLGFGSVVYGLFCFSCGYHEYFGEEGPQILVVPSRVYKFGRNSADSV
jgi:hypothetical protein